MPSPGQKLMMSGKPQGLSLFQQVLAICAGGTVITADRYVLDGVSGKVGSFQDWLDPTHLFAQTVSTDQVALPTANAALGNSICANFTRAQIYVSSRAATAWNYLMSAHTTFIVFSYTSFPYYEVLWEAAGAQTNSAAYYAYGTTITNHVIRTGTATISTANVPGSGAGYVEAFDQVGSGSPEQSVMFRPGGTAVTAATLGGALGAISDTASIGDRTTRTLGFGGKLRAIVIAPRLLNASEMTTVRSWIQADTGIAP